MIVYCTTPDSPDVARVVLGPADLLTAGAGDTVLLIGGATDGDHARWSSAIGQAAMRGATVRQRAA